MISTDNAAGFSGTNAGGDLAIVNSEWTGNLAGIVPNTLDSEAGPPQHDILIAGNDVHDNNNRSAPTLALTYPSFGIGILVTGGRDDQVTGNLVEDQRDVRHRRPSDARPEPVDDRRQRRDRQRRASQRLGGSRTRCAVGRG